MLAACSRRAITRPRPVGSNRASAAGSYSLQLEDLRPVVRDAALLRWQRGQHFGAVAEAARAANAALQAKLGRWDISDKRLTESAFGPADPEPGIPRLRFRNEISAETMHSRLCGARDLGKACFSGISNVAAHKEKLNWSAGEAFEYLVELGTLSRWIDECVVVRGD